MNGFQSHIFVAGDSNKIIIHSSVNHCNASDYFSDLYEDDNNIYDKAKNRQSSQFPEFI